MLLIGIAILLWRKSNVYARETIDVNDATVISHALRNDLPYVIKPLSYFGAAMGLALISIAFAGIGYQLFAAPPQEAISGAFADYPMLEATFISGLYAITGIGAILLPFVLREHPHPAIGKIIKLCWSIADVIFILFGAMNYFTHIGLIINTSG